MCCLGGSDNETAVSDLENAGDGSVQRLSKGDQAIPQGDCSCGDIPESPAEGQSLARPWMAHIMLTSDKTVECSGVLINKRWIISAAHCFCSAKTVKTNILRIQYLLCFDL